MKKILFIIVIVLIISTGIFFWKKTQVIKDISSIRSLEKPTSSSTIKRNMKITSSAFNTNENIPSKYTCNGNNSNPPLTFSNIPENAKSLVLIVDDPDAPVGTWVHWIIFNIPPTVKEISENTIPNGIQAMTSFGKPGYGGPCPPSGTHHYHFKLYALDAILDLDKNADKSAVEQKMQGHILDQADLIGLYSK